MPNPTTPLQIHPLQTHTFTNPQPSSVNSYPPSVYTPSPSGNVSSGTYMQLQYTPHPQYMQMAPQNPIAPICECWSPILEFGTKAPTMS